MNIRVRFGKEGMLQFIGHLDVLRTFQKIFRRAGLPMSFSQGFSPHPIMSIAMPLGLGMTSEGEYLDASLEADIPPREILQRLQAATAENLPVYQVSLLPEKAGNAMATVGRAVYRFTPRENSPETDRMLGKAVGSLLAEKTLVIMKKTKTKEAETDIRPLIYRAVWNGKDLTAELSAGSMANLSPDLFMEVLLGRAGQSYERSGWLVRRLDLLRADGSSLGDFSACGKENDRG